MKGEGSCCSRALPQARPIHQESHIPPIASIPGTGRVVGQAQFQGLQAARVAILSARPLTEFSIGASANAS